MASNVNFNILGCAHSFEIEWLPAYELPLFSLPFLSLRGTCSTFFRVIPLGGVSIIPGIDLVSSVLQNTFLSPSGCRSF